MIDYYDAQDAAADAHIWTRHECQECGQSFYHEDDDAELCQDCSGEAEDEAIRQHERDHMPGRI